jgi:F-type H+-transporting ATPase subunit b
MKRYLAIAVLMQLLLTVPALAAGGAGGNPFEGRIYQGIAAAVVFLVLFVVLKAKAWGPILKGLQDRENKIKEDLDKAEKSAGEAANTLKEYQERLAAAQDEARQIIEKGRTDAETIAGQLKEQAQTDLDQMKQRATDEIEAAKQRALGEIYAQTATLATHVAGSIIGKELSVDDQQGLVDDALAKYKEGQDN